MGLVDVVISYTFIRDMTMPFDKTGAYKVGIIDKDGNFLVNKNKDKLTSDQRNNYPNKLTILAWNIKRLLSKVGIGRSAIASFASALYLLKEEIGDDDMNSIQKRVLNLVEETIFDSDREKMINEAFGSSLLPTNLDPGNYVISETTVSIKKSEKPISYHMGIPLYEAKNREGKRIVFSKSDIEEEVPTNNIGGGMIKGAAPGEDPPIRVKKKKKIYELMGRYTVFEVSPEEFEKCSCAKRKFEKWNKFFDEDSETGSSIKNYSHRNPEKGIILRNSETGQTMMFRRRWSDQRLSHNRKAKLLTQSKNEAFSIWTR